MKLKPYPEYKDSGVEWIGQVPIGWSIDRLKRSIDSCKNGIWGDEAQGNENDIACVRVADFNRRKLNVVLNEPTIRNVTEKEQSSRLLRKGHLLLEKSGGGENQPVGCVVLYEDTKPAVCSNFVARIELADGMDPSFWRYIHATAYSIRLTVGSINQTSGIQNLDQDRYFDERACFPSFHEQVAIASFLDRETAKLDTLISKQEHLIDLLQEKRQAIISHAVTKGLNPDARMKDSGVDWLGLVPEGWNITKIKYIANLNPKVPDWVKTTSDLSCNFLPMEKIGDDGKCILDAEREVADVIAGYTYFENGDVCYAKVTPCFENGKGAVFSDLKNGIGFGTTEVTVFRPTKLILSDLLYFIFQSTYFKSVGESTMTGAGGLKRVSDSVGANLIIAIPSLPEQVKLLNELKLMIKSVDELTDKAKCSIDLAKEHRTALISAAVTGKIDVRDYVNDLEAA